MADIPEVDAALRAAAHGHRGRLVALLAVRTRDIAAAEDAVAEAIAQACMSWPRDGIPQNPAGWLLAVARNRWRDMARHAQVEADFAADWLHRFPEAAMAPDTEAGGVSDDRLKLMFVCAHPALHQAVHAPLMLQVVLGVPVERMAPLFLSSPGTLGQRLSRAKTNIRDAGIAFEMPSVEHLPSRLPAVLDALYGAYCLGWEADGPDDAATWSEMTGEAIYLARMLAAQLPSPEVLGLLALMLWCESRRAGRRGAAGEFVPLDQQDVGCWDRAMMAEAAGLLAHASQAGQLGRYQLEAAIQSVQAHRADSGDTDWHAIALLYQGLLAQSPTLGYQLGFISVLERLEGAEVAWEHLSALPRDTVRSYQPYWVLLAHLHEALGAMPEAEHARSVALGLTRNTAMRRHLERLGASVAVMDAR